MSFFFDKVDDSKYMGQTIQSGGEVLGFDEAYDATVDLVRATESTASKVNMMGDILTPILETIEERSGTKLKNPGDYPDTMSSSRGHWERVRQGQLDKIFDHLRENADLYPEYANLTPELLETQMQQRALEIYNESQETLSRTGGVGGFMGNLAGGFTGALQDPAMVDMMLVGGPLMAGGKGLAGMVVRDTLIGMGTEAVLQTGVKEWYEELGLDYTWGDFVRNVAITGAIGGAMPVAFKGAGKGISFTNDQLKKAVSAFRKDGLMTQETADILDDAIEDSIILSEMPDGETDIVAHTARAEQATNDVMDGKPPEIDVEPDAPRPVVEDLDLTDADIEALVRSFDEIGDDEVINLDIDGTEGVAVTGKQLKEDAAQEAGMLERLRGCVIR